MLLENWSEPSQCLRSFLPGVSDSLLEQQQQEVDALCVEVSPAPGGWKRQSPVAAGKNDASEYNELSSGCRASLRGDHTENVATEKILFQLKGAGIAKLLREFIYSE